MVKSQGIPCKPITQHVGGVCGDSNECLRKD